MLTTNPGEFDPRKYLKPALEAMQKVCEARFNEFGAAGHADKIRPLPLTAMAKRYASGSCRRSSRPPETTRPAGAGLLAWATDRPNRVAGSLANAQRRRSAHMRGRPEVAGPLNEVPSPGKRNLI